jgi:sugar (pentulose or hexulose) kinase
MEFIAIDIGTSFTKGAIVNVEAMEVRFVIRNPAAVQLPSGNPLLHELDPVSVIDGVKSVIGNLLNAADKCRGILLTGQMGGLVLCNESAKALRPYISWLDRRVTQQISTGDQSYFDALADIVGDRASRVLGNEFRPGLPLSFLFYLLQTRELQQYCGAIPVTLPDYVAAALCETRPVMELTNATGLLDTASRSFPTELFKELELTNLNWPQIVDFRHRVGHYNVNGKSLPVYAATGDHQCSLAGTLLAHNELSINISTGSQVSMLTDNADIKDFQLRPYFDGRLLKTITNIPAGRALTAIIRLLTEASANANDAGAAWDYFFEQAAATAVSDIDMNLAFFPGVIQGPGAFANLREDNMTVGHFARAALEQMADYFDQMGHRISPEHDFSRLVFSGGIAQRSALLRKRIEEKLNSNSRTASTSEDTLFGALVLGRVIGGFETSVAEASTFIRQHFDQAGNSRS